jgi:peptide/nickel transport system substrate-binding protein
MERAYLDRRDLLRLLGAGAGVAAGGALTRPSFASAQEASPAADRSGQLQIGKAQEAVGLDPALVTAASSFQIIFPVYEQLVAFDAENQPQPELATEWENPDDTTFIFHLREDVTFHDGTPLTAAAVKHSFERILDPDLASPWLSQLEPIESIEVVDDLTVQLNLSQAYGPLLATLGQPYAAIVPESDADLQTTMIGTGPFRLEAYTQDVETVMAANPDYWDAGAPLLAGLTYRILPDEAARLAAVRTGEINLTTLANPAAVSLASREEGVQVVTQETTDYYLLGFNTRQAPLDDVRVRQAISLSVDRQALLDAVFFGEGRVTGPIVPTLGDWATPVEELPFSTPDPARAAELLAEAGLEGGFELSIMASPLYPEFINIALVLQSQLQAAGITVVLDQVEWGTFIERWRERDFVSFVSFNGSGNDPDRALFPAFSTDGSVNAFQFSDPAIDELLAEGRATFDTERRREIYREVEQFLAEAAPALFLATRMAYYALGNNVQGFEPNPIDTWDTLERTSLS